MSVASSSVSASSSTAITTSQDSRRQSARDTPPASTRSPDDRAYFGRTAGGSTSNANVVVFRSERQSCIRNRLRGKADGFGLLRQLLDLEKINNSDLKVQKASYIHGLAMARVLPRVDRFNAVFDNDGKLNLDPAQGPGRILGSREDQVLGSFIFDIDPKTTRTKTEIANRVPPHLYEEWPAIAKGLRYIEDNETKNKIILLLTDVELRKARLRFYKKSYKYGEMLRCQLEGWLGYMDDLQESAYPDQPNATKKLTEMIHKLDHVNVHAGGQRKNSEDVHSEFWRSLRGVSSNSS